MKRLNKRCRYVCSIVDNEGQPGFKIRIVEPGEEDVVLLDVSPKAVWNKVLEPLDKLRRNADLVKIFPSFTSGEELFGLTEQAIVRVLESVSWFHSVIWALRSCFCIVNVLLSTPEIFMFHSFLAQICWQTTTLNSLALWGLRCPWLSTPQGVHAQSQNWGLISESKHFLCYAKNQLKSGTVFFKFQASKMFKDFINVYRIMCITLYNDVLQTPYPPICQHLTLPPSDCDRGLRRYQFSLHETICSFQVGTV